MKFNQLKAIGGPEMWVIRSALGGSLTVTTTSDVISEVRQALSYGSRTITIERQGSPDEPKSPPERSLSLVPVASGAGQGVCSCGWRSKVADDVSDYYGIGDIHAEFAAHACLHDNPGAIRPATYETTSRQSAPVAWHLSDTPETDAALVDHMPEPSEWSRHYLVLSRLCRKLERERNALIQ